MKTQLLLALVVALSACGDELADTMITRIAPRSVVRLATPAEQRAVTVVPQSYVVAFRPGLTAPPPRFTSFAAEVRHHGAFLADVEADPRVEAVRFIAAVDLNDPREPGAPAPARPPTERLAWGARDLPPAVAQLAAVRFAAGDAAASALAAWENADRIWFAEPNFASTLSQEEGESSLPGFTPELAQSYAATGIWWHQSIGLNEALNALAARAILAPSHPIIAVLDSGVDVRNSGLVNHIWKNPAKNTSGCRNDEFGCNTTVADKTAFGDGAVNPYTTSGFDQACPNKDAKQGSKERSEADTCSHGTHVAGIIAGNPEGSGDSAIGGSCPVCRIMPIRIIGEIEGLGRASSVAILNAMKYLTHFQTPKGNSAVRVVNSSFGTYSRSRAVALLTTVLSREPHQILVIGAAGNEDSMIRSYPAAFPEAIAVAALGKDDGKALYSNFGPWVSVAAPGGDGGSQLPLIYSTVPGPNGRSAKQGTSMAAPVVSGVAGLVLSVDPGRSFAKLRSSIIRTADPRIYAATVRGGNNQEFYNPLLTGDSARAPLLGSGVVSALHAIDDDRDSGYSAPGLDTVESSCGAAGGGASVAAVPTFLLLLLLATPAVAALYSASFVKAESAYRSTMRETRRVPGNANV